MVCEVRVTNLDLSVVGDARLVDVSLVYDNLGEQLEQRTGVPWRSVRQALITPAEYQAPS
jgi:hypothetical protein